MNQEKITRQLYAKITGCSSLPETPRLAFEIEEIVEILEELGYEVKVHNGPAKVTYRAWEAPGEYTDDVRETPDWRCIVAVKPNEVLPTRVDECGKFGMMTVFNREMKNRFRMLVTSFGK